MCKHVVKASMQMVVGLKYKWGTTFEHILLNNYMKKININVFPLIGRPYLYTSWVADPCQDPGI